MTIIRTTEAADKVLAVIEALAPAAPDLYLEPYQNGREHGWALQVIWATTGYSCKIAFAEDRNSDQIVVYDGKLHLFDPAGNVPNGKAYDQRRYFNPDAIDEAARYILSALIPA